MNIIFLDIDGVLNNRQSDSLLFECIPSKYRIDENNLKATDMQAAIGCAQLDKFPSFVVRRRENFERLFNKLSNAKLTEKLILPKALDNSKPSWFGFLITCKASVDRNELVRFLESSGIQTRMLFSGNLIKHPCFDEMRSTGEGFRVVGELVNTDTIMNHSFWIGVYPGMTNDMIDYMADKIIEFCR